MHKEDLVGGPEGLVVMKIRTSDGQVIRTGRGLASVVQVLNADYRLNILRCHFPDFGPFLGGPGLSFGPFVQAVDPARLGQRSFRGSRRVDGSSSCDLQILNKHC